MALVVPKFATEAEEADWWYDNRDLVTEEFIAAAKEGRLGRGTAMRRAQEADTRALAEALKLDSQDEQKVRAVAEKQGVLFSEAVGKLVHEALEKHNESAAA